MFKTAVWVILALLLLAAALLIWWALSRGKSQAAQRADEQQRDGDVTHCAPHARP